MIDELQKERGSVYGKYEAQARFVGQVIHAFQDCAQANSRLPRHEDIGSIAYMAIKMARLAVSPDHHDTLTDLESYTNLHRRMKLEQHG